MELTTDLAVRVKSNGITAAFVPRASRDPTPLDWERWAPTIAARYKSVPARVLIGEMNAEGLNVTEKMFRDRLQKWGMNDKNRRSAARPRRRALQSAGKGDKPSNPGPLYNMNGRNSSRPVMLYQENIRNLLQTPKEMLVLQRTLKGVLDWQQHAEGSTMDLSDSWTFVDLIKDMERCVLVSDKISPMCEKIMPHFRSTSAKLQSHMITCNPLAVLLSVDGLLNFAWKRNSSPWYYETSRFLINAAVETFPNSHPSLLLLRMLLSKLTPTQLVMIEEVGSSVIAQYYGAAKALVFRGNMHSAAARTGLSTSTRPYAEALRAATSPASDATSPRSLYDFARLHWQTGHYAKSADILRRCLAQIEDEGDGDSSTLIAALQALAFVQDRQNDFVGQEITLQNLLKAILARDRRESHTPQLSIYALTAIAALYAFYAHFGLNEQRDALHLEYPSAFEL